MFTPNLHNSIQEHYVTQPMDIKIDTLRGHFNTTSSNNSKKISLHFDVLSIDYVDKVYILANNSFWADQVEIEKLQKPFLSYTFLKEGMKDTINMVLVVKTPYVSHIMNSTDVYTSQGIEILAISYLVNQPIDLLL